MVYPLFELYETCLTNLLRIDRKGQRLVWWRRSCGVLEVWGRTYPTGELDDSCDEHRQRKGSDDCSTTGIYFCLNLHIAITAPGPLDTGFDVMLSNLLWCCLNLCSFFSCSPMLWSVLHSTTTTMIKHAIYIWLYEIVAVHFEEIWATAAEEKTIKLSRDKKVFESWLDIFQKHFSSWFQ